MQKKLLIISAIFVLISTILYAFILIRKAKNSTLIPPETELVGEDSLLGGSTIPTTPLVVPNMSPETERKIDALKGSWENLGDGFYTVKNVPALEAPSIIPDYSIGYNENQKIFSITLYKDSLLENRQKAGQDIMTLLGINQDETCKLDVQVYIPDSVNVDYANKNLKLSFCPGFTDLQGVLANNGISNIDPDSPEENPSDIAL